MKYLAILGRQAEISMAELEALYGKVVRSGKELATFETDATPEIKRLGGTIKLAVKIEQTPLEYLSGTKEGKITFGISDYSENSSFSKTRAEALKIKKILTRHGRSVRVVESTGATLKTATVLHNGLSGKNMRKIEFIRVFQEWYRTIGVQDIDAYAKRDQNRPFRDARVGMLPPKLAQILINLCGDLGYRATILDPFCGTGVVLQEAILMGYLAYGTDVSERMVEYTEKNLAWLVQDNESKGGSGSGKNSGGNQNRAKGVVSNTRDCNYRVSLGDATTFEWKQPIDAVACEGYLGVPMSVCPTEIKLKEQKQICGGIILGFLRNLAGQVESGFKVVLAAPAWLRADGAYQRLDIIDEIENMGYNVDNRTRAGLLYHREGQIVARDIIILRKR